MGSSNIRRGQELALLGAIGRQVQGAEFRG